MRVSASPPHFPFPSPKLRVGRIQLAPLALCEDDLARLPCITCGDEVIATIPGQVNYMHEAPALQFAQASADIRSRQAKQGHDLLGIQRPIRDVEQGMNLGNAAVDSPARAHFAPVKNELVSDFG
jgi:hypothetical protein